MTMPDLYLVAILFVLFIANTVIQYRIGFKLGAHGGYTVGIFHATSWITRNKTEFEETDMTVVELSRHIVKEMAATPFTDVDAKKLAG